MIFDKSAFFDGRKAFPELLTSINELVNQIQLSETERAHERTIGDTDQADKSTIEFKPNPKDDPNDQ